MSKCLDCGKEYHRDSGPMICVCTECLQKPSPPPAWVERNGLMVPSDPLVASKHPGDVAE